MAAKNPIEKQVQKEVVTKQTVTLRTRIFRFYIVLAIATFAQLAILAKVIPYFSWDANFSKNLQELSIPFLNQFMELVSWPGYFPQSVLIGSLIILFFIVAKWYWESLVALISFSGMEIMVNLLKHGVGRIRPLGTHLTGNSFPSGHVVDYTVVLGFLLYLTYSIIKKSKVRQTLLGLLCIPILLVGFSRIYLAAHWPSDVIGAYLFASLWLSATIWFYRYGQSRKWVKSAVQQSPGTK